jgi:REP element-mobilizing transposase RayT
MPGRYACVRLHLVWSTKRRLPWLDARWRPRLYGVLANIAGRKGAALHCAGGASDHVHLYLDCPTSVAVSDLVEALKANSSRWVRTTCVDRGGFEWQVGFGAFSVNPVDDRRLREYIRSQEVRHRERSFMEEYMGLLDEHGIDYDLHGVFE